MSIIVAGFNNAPNVKAYNWSDTSGWGTALPDPGASISTFVYGLKYKSGVMLAGTNASPFIHAYTFSSGGRGTKYSNPSVLPSGNGRRVDWNKTGTAVGIATTGSPYVHAYSRTGGFGTKYPNPPVTPAVTSGVVIRWNGDVVYRGGSGTNVLGAMVWNDTTGFGVPYGLPSIPPAGQVWEIVARGDYVLCVHDNSPYITGYPWNNITGFGVKYTNPGTLPGANPRGLDISSTNNVVYTASLSSPFVGAWNFNSSSGFGAYLGAASASTIHLSVKRGVDAVFMGGSGANVLTAEAWTGGARGTNYGSSSPGITGQIWALEFVQFGSGGGNFLPFFDY